MSLGRLFEPTLIRSNKVGNLLRDNGGQTPQDVALMSVRRTQSSNQVTFSYIADNPPLASLLDSGQFGCSWFLLPRMSVDILLFGLLQRFSEIGNWA